MFMKKKVLHAEFVMVICKYGLIRYIKCGDFVMVWLICCDLLFVNNSHYKKICIRTFPE